MKTIHTVTMVSPNTSSRIVGWFDTYEEAEQTVIDNVGDIQECNFRFCVIEEIIGNRVYPCPPLIEQWYKWHEGCYKRIDKPERYKRVVNFGIG